MEISSYGMTNVGCRREKNEDSYLINTDQNLYVVADGMGGHLGGETASRLAVSTAEEIIVGLAEDPEMTLQTDIPIATGDYKNYLKYAINVANGRIFEKASRDPSLRGMGTTIVALLFRDNKAFFANVGDSRCYLIRAGRIKQLTQDHSLVNEQLKAGMISVTDVRNHKLKNIITRSVGFQQGVEIDIMSRNLKIGDKFLLCSDGLTNMLPNGEILSVAAELPPKGACIKLIELANQKGGDDNITVLITEVLSVKERPVQDEDTEGI